MPIITAPTLAWLIHERGLSFAVCAAVASVSACAMLACFSVGYAPAARHGGKRWALLCGFAGALALTWPAFAASGSLTDALMLGLGCTVLALCRIPGSAYQAVARPRPHGSLVWAALAAGSLTALATTAGPALGSFAARLLASLPVDSAAVAMVEHAHGGHRAASNFLRGYAWGLLGKAAFGAAFVLLAPPHRWAGSLGAGLRLCGPVFPGESGAFAPRVATAPGRTAGQAGQAGVTR